MRSSILIATAAAVIGATAQDPCQTKYKTCIAAGNSEVLCDCRLATCDGEDSARERDFCATATAGMTFKTASVSASSTTSASTQGSNGTASTTVSISGATSAYAVITGGSKNVTTITTSCTSGSAAAATGSGAAATHSVTPYTGAATQTGLSAALALVVGVFAFLA